MSLIAIIYKLLTLLDPLDLQCSVEHMNEVALSCSFDWKVVGRRLLGEQAIEDIDREEDNEQRKRDKMFVKWREQEGSKVTYRVLIGVFEEVGNRQAAEVVTALLPPIAKGRCCHCVTLLTSTNNSFCTN